MLGEQIGEEKGKITGNRVLPADPQFGAQVEVSFQAAGKLFGQNVNDMGTYVCYMSKNKQYHGHGQGVITTNEGDSAYWTGQGIGTPTGKGQAANWRGSLFFHTDSTSKLSRLNETVVMFEYNVDENGNTSNKTFEWK